MPKGKGGNTVAAVWEIAEPIARELGLEIWDIRFVKEGADWFLRIFIDKDGGVGIEDCERMSRATALKFRPPESKESLREKLILKPARAKK